MLTINPLAAGRGADYLIHSVGRENEMVHEIDQADVAAYFDAATREGEPAGRWMGSLAGEWGLAGEEVGRVELRRLFGHGRHPLSGELIGRAPRTYRPLEERVAAMEAKGERLGWDPERLAEAVIRVRAGGERVARTGYDCTFTAPKSVSILFGLSIDTEVRQQVLQCHEEAVAKAVEWLDQTALTRVGTDGVRQVDATGVCAAAFTHRTSRAGDPHLHTHVALAAKVQATTGRWLAIDGRGLWLRAAEIRNVYEGELMSGLSERLGVQWTRREATGVMELRGCSEELIERFSKRHRQIEDAREAGTAPTKGEPGFKEADRAVWFRTRQRKQEGQTTITLNQRWRIEASTLQPFLLDDLTGFSEPPLPINGTKWDVLVQEAEAAVDPATPARVLGERRGWKLTDLDDAEWDRLDAALDAAIPDRRALATMRLVSSERSTWTASHVAGAAKRVIEAHPELVKLTVGPGRRAVMQRLDVAAEIEATTAHVLAVCRRLTPDDPTRGYGPVRRDGRSVYEHVGQVRYTSDTHLSTERQVLGFAAAKGAVTFDRDQALAGAGEVLRPDGSTRRALSGDQRRVLVDLLGHDARLRVLVGPAGTGKTTTMDALVAAYRARGLSVVGLAPYQVAAQELGEATGMTTMNLSRFLSPRSEAAQQLHSTLRPGTLVVLDEAGTATSAQMAALVEIAGQHGCDLLMVGDHEQLPAVGAGGLFADLARVPGAVELSEVQRFRDGATVREWEAKASLRLRDGDPGALAAYEAHDRIVGGERDDLVDEIVAAAVSDRLAGKATLALAPSEAEAHHIARAIQARLVEAGVVDATKTVKVRGGLRAGVGDQIQTRRNDHHKGVANRDMWTIAKVHTNKSVTVVGDDGRRAHLTPDYVAADVSLGYAGTIHAAQGATVDTARVLVDRATPAAALYVGMTRGRTLNMAYVATDTEGYAAGESTDPVAILGERLRAGTDNVASATTIERSHAERYDSLSWLAPVMVDLQRADTQPLDVQSLIAQADIPLSRVMATSAGWDSLVRYVSDLSRAGWDVRQAVPAAVASRNFIDAESPAAVLHHRLYNRFGEAGDVYVAGQVVPPTPAATREQWCRRVFGPTTDQAQAAVADQVASRMAELADQAVGAQARWLEEIPGTGAAHRAAVEAVAAYRDLTGYAQRDPIGPMPPVGDVTARSAWKVAHDTIRYAGIDTKIPRSPAHVVRTAATLRRIPTTLDEATRTEITRRAGTEGQVVTEDLLPAVTDDEALVALAARDRLAALTPDERAQAEQTIARLSRLPDAMGPTFTRPTRERTRGLER